MPKMAKKKKPKRNFEDEEDAPTISTSNSKPVEIDDEDNSPVVSQSNEMKKKHKKNPIDDPKKVPFPFSLDGSSLFHLNLSLNFFKLGFFFSFFFEEF